jgi:hypothetical protein
MPSLIVETKTFESLLREVVIDRIKAMDIPDSKLVGVGTPIYLLSEINCENGCAKMHMPDNFFSDIESLGIKIKDCKELEEIANGSGKRIFYYSISITAFDEYEAEATLHFGVACVAPNSDRGCMLCCCGADARYWKAGGHWRFIEWGIEICQ